MNYWDSVGRWINTLLVFIVGLLAFDALFRLLEANEDNIIVAFVRVLSVVFLVPFRGMFGEQDYLLTTLVGVLGYALLAGIALGVLRSLQASFAQPAPPVRPGAVPEQPVTQVVAEPDGPPPSAGVDGAPPGGVPQGDRDTGTAAPAVPPSSPVTPAPPPPEPSDAGGHNGMARRADPNGRARRLRSRDLSRDRAAAPQTASRTPDPGA